MSYIDELELNEIFSYLIGLPIREAITMIGHNMVIREVIREGKEFEIDSIYKDNRLNVETRGGRIFRVLNIS